MTWPDAAAIVGSAWAGAWALVQVVRVLATGPLPAVSCECDDEEQQP